MSRSRGNDLLDAGEVATLLGFDANKLLQTFYSPARPGLPGADLSDPRKLQWRRGDIERLQALRQLPRRGPAVKQARDDRPVASTPDWEQRKRKGRQYGRA